MSAILQIGATADMDSGKVETAFQVFLRLVSASCIVAGLSYWARLTGYSDGGLYRFDLIASYWQVASVSLCVLFPVAAVGLWMYVSWGPVIWGVAAATEVTMYLGLSEWFGTRPLLVFAHFMVAFIYIGLRLALFLLRRREAQMVTNDSL